MRKLFFAICCNLCVLSAAYARITPISGYVNVTPQVVGDKNNAIKEVNKDEFSLFLKERFNKAQKAREGDVNKTSSVVESKIEQMRKKESEKGFFEKVYERAVSKINHPSDEVRDDMAQDENADMNLGINPEDIIAEIDSQNRQWKEQALPHVMAYLPFSDEPVKVPAIEHIPYLMNNIEVLPNGMVKFEETVVVVANGQKLNSGLTKILPSKIYTSPSIAKKMFGYSGS